MTTVFLKFFLFSNRQKTIFGQYYAIANENDTLSCVTYNGSLFHTSLIYKAFHFLFLKKIQLSVVILAFQFLY